MLSINTNIWNSGLARNLALTKSGLLNTMSQLSSGLRINKASDDPAGLVISEQLRSRIASLNQEIENTSAAISKYETASSTVMDLRSKLVDLRSMAIGAANEGGNDPASQEAWANAANDVVASYNQVIANAEYNGSQMLDGSAGSLATVTNLTDIDLSSAATAEQSIANVDAAMAELDSVQIDLASTQKYQLESHRNSLQITSQNLQAAESQIRDVDYARTYSRMVGGMIRMQAGLAMMSHSNMLGKGVLQLFGSRQ